MSSAQQAITTSRPGCIMILLDQSESMGRPSGIPGKSRAQALADAVNELILEQINWCTKGDAIVNRFYFGLIGYGGAEAAPRLCSPTKSPLLTASELADEVLSDPKVPDGDPFWFTPQAGGDTPMHHAFEITNVILNEWVSKHKQSYPPVVCNITDAEWTGNDPTTEMSKCASIRTDVGSVRLFNATIRPDQYTVEYPDNSDQLADSLSKQLFQHSSLVPDEMKGMLTERRGVRLAPKARGLIHNGHVAQISQMLYVGSATVIGNVRG